MNCQACELPLFTYDEHRVSCKNGHIWTLPEHADKPATVGPAMPATALVRPLRNDPARPWLIGAIGLLVLDVLIGIANLVV